MSAASHEPTASRTLPHVAVQTDVGVVRERNEDAAYADPHGWYWIVADGMGGHGAGDIAANIAVETVRHVLDEARTRLAVLAVAPPAKRRSTVRALLDRAVRSANDAVNERAFREPDKHGMGTTLEVVVLVGADVFVAHVGDSRTYLVHDGRAVQLTCDHTVAEAMRRKGALSAADAAVSPMRSVLVNAIGVTPTVDVELTQIELRPGDRVFACSDGLYDYLSAAEIADWVAREPIELTLAAMVELARTRGGHDNITGIIVDPVAPVATQAPTWDEDTKPRMPNVPRRRGSRAPFDDAPSPFAGMTDDALCSVIEHTLREEKSQPHVLHRAVTSIEP